MTEPSLDGEVHVGKAYNLCRVYNPFEWSVPTVWAGYGVVLTTSELPTVGCVGKGWIPLVALLVECAYYVSCMSVPSRRVRWSLLSTFVLTLIDILQRILTLCQKTTSRSCPHPS